MSSEVAEGPSTSASTDKEKMEAKVKALNLMGQGKRNLICKEIPSAVQLFEDACETLSSTFGEMANECADAYLEYGGALLELARMEQGVLGLALKDVDVDEEDLDEAEEGKDSVEKKDSEEVDEGGTKEEEDDAEDEEGEGEEDDEQMEEGGKQVEKEQGEPDADDVSNLQLAWEMIELSKLIYNREGYKLKAAEAHLKLGEISLESEEFETAINDFKACLEIQLQSSEPHDRAIAETHYQIGIAQQLHKEHLDEAAVSFRAALKCLELKMEKLKEIISENPPTEPGSVYSPKEAAVKEIDEIEKILPEIQEKIKEIETEVSEEGDLKKMAKEAMGTLFATTTDLGFASSTANTTTAKEEKKPVAMDINHLIRKKRKPEGEEETTADDKKHKLEGAGNSTTNGHSEENVTETTS